LICFDGETYHNTAIGFKVSAERIIMHNRS
jgi:hypothetical protein